ncbi:glycoside hydrolase [Agrobacterium tumefaciens]|nr:glycoside hydrolase [Agrobacterium tumefaciens]
MPVNKIVATKRGKAAIAAAVIAAAAAGWTALSTPSSTNPPPAVVLATDTLIKPWEGLTLVSHWDRYAKIWDICYGETKGITAGVRKTKAECEDMLRRRVFNDYYLPLTRQIPGFTSMPIGVQASMVSGAYNFGVYGMVNSRAAALHRQGRHREGCEAQTAWNKAGGQVVNGLVKRREMGDAQRAGEAEVCVSGLGGAAK